MFGPQLPPCSTDINDQIPTYEESTQFENIESGEKVKIAFGKLKKALSVFIVHHTQKATAAILGHVKLSNSAAITKPGEYAQDAIDLCIPILQYPQPPKQYIDINFLLLYLCNNHQFSHLLSRCLQILFRLC